MREANVVGFMPSNSAVPPGPETFPLVCFKAFIMGSRSCPFNSSRVGSAPFVIGVACLSEGVLARAEARWKVSGPSLQRIMARSIVF